MTTNNLTGRQRPATVRGAMALTVALLGFAAPAQATFPGRNGDFAYGFELGYSTDEYSYESYAWRVGMIGQDGHARRFVTYGREPAFSPRGTRLAVAQRSDWGSAAVTLSGRPLMRLSSGIDRAPAWSPAGRRVAFERFRCTGLVETLVCPKARGIWTVGLDGDAERLVGEGSDPAWSSRGEIAFTVAEDHCPDCQIAPEGELRVVPARGGDSRLLTHGSAPDWSPSGRQLAFTTGKALYQGFSELHAINRDGSGQRRIYSSSRRGISSPTWSPDGRQVAFILGSDTVVAVASRGGRPRRLFTLPCPERLCEDGSYDFVTDIAWQPLRRARPQGFTSIPRQKVNAPIGKPQLR